MRAIYNFCKAQIKAKKLNRKPVIVVDTSWVTRKRSPEYIAKALLHEGFDVILVLDPDHRHHAKVASIERRGKREGARSNPSKELGHE